MKPETPIEKAILENQIGMYAICDEKEGSFDYWIAGYYTGGQLQRACICRSMINNPKMIFADEPTGTLNCTSSAEVMEEFVKNDHYAGNSRCKGCGKVYKIGDFSMKMSDK